jgi:hypothetical protein
VKKPKKPHSEYRWVNVFIDDNGDDFFGGMLTRNAKDLPSFVSGRPSRKVRVKVVELPAKRK